MVRSQLPLVQGGDDDLVVQLGDAANSKTFSISASTVIGVTSPPSDLALLFIPPSWGGFFCPYFVSLLLFLFVICQSIALFLLWRSLLFGLSSLPFCLASQTNSFFLHSSIYPATLDPWLEHPWCVWISPCIAYIPSRIFPLLYTLLGFHSLGI